MTSSGFSDVSAAKNDNQGKTQSCENASDKSKAKSKNPHCDETDPPPTECPTGQHYDEFGNCVDDEPPTPGGFTSCDTDEVFGISPDEFDAAGFSVTQAGINHVEDLVFGEGGVTNDNGLIDTADELNKLNFLISTTCLL